MPWVSTWASYHTAGPGVHEEKLKSSEILRSALTFAVRHVYQAAAPQYDNLFISMHVPHQDATGFMPRKNPNIQFVVSPGREIVQVTLWSDSSVDSRGEPRGLTRTQDHISNPQNPRSKLRCVMYCITILRSSQRATVVFPVLPLDQPYGLCSLSSLPPPRDVILGL